MRLMSHSIQGCYLNKFLNLYVIIMSILYSSLSLREQIIPYDYYRFFYFGLGMLMHMYVVYIFIYIKYPTHSMRSVSINNVQNVACLSCFPSNDLFAMENFSDLWFSLVCISYRYSEIRSLLNRWFYLFHPILKISLWKIIFEIKKIKKKMESKLMI